VRLHRHPFLLKHYGLLPHRVMNAAVARLARVNAPQPVVSMIAAALVGGIHLDGLKHAAWRGPAVHPIGATLKKGSRLGHFAFGSTVVVVLPRSAVQACLLEPGQPVRMGQSLLQLT